MQVLGNAALPHTLGSNTLKSATHRWDVEVVLCGGPVTHARVVCVWLVRVGRGWLGDGHVGPGHVQQATLAPAGLDDLCSCDVSCKGGDREREGGSEWTHAFGRVKLVTSHLFFWGGGGSKTGHVTLVFVRISELSSMEGGHDHLIQGRG